MKTLTSVSQGSVQFQNSDIVGVRDGVEGRVIDPFRNAEVLMFGVVRPVEIMFTQTHHLPVGQDETVSFRVRT